MKKISKYLLGLIVIPIVFTTSCLKDLGNYDYTNVYVTDDGTVIDLTQGIQIDTIGEAKLRSVINPANVGNHVRFKPVLNYPRDLSKLEFVWTIYDYIYRQVQEGNTMKWPAADTISLEHELDWTIDVAPGTYYIEFRATDPELNIFGSRRYLVNLSSAGSLSGFYLLSEYDGETDIDFMGASKTGVMAHDTIIRRSYYSSLNLGRIPGKPRLMGRSTYRFPGASFAETFFYVFTEETGQRVHINDMQVMAEINDMFYNVPAHNPQAFWHINNCDFLINNGRLHVLYTDSANNHRFSAPVAGTYQASPFLVRQPRQTWRPAEGEQNADQIIFDELSNSFRPYFPRTSSLSRWNPTSGDAILDVNNLGIKPIGIVEVENNVACIVNIGGEYRLHTFRFFGRIDNGDLTATGLWNPKSLSGCENISEAKIFAASNSGSVIFYATNNRLYAFPGAALNPASYLLHQCEPGEEITAMYHLGTYGGPPIAGRLLWVAVWNESTKEGKVLEFSIDLNNGQPITLPWYPVGYTNRDNPRVIKPVGGFGKIKEIIPSSGFN
jgi:hypothetical protein